MHVRRVRVSDDVEMAIAEAGSGRPLLLLHGFTGSKEDFTDWVDDLAALGWHVVVPDHRGHGESSKPASESAYSISILADDALALVDHIGWEHFALLGHSMGGFIAQEIAFRRPLDALILMDTRHGPLSSLDPKMVDAAVHIVRSAGIGALADRLVGSPLDTEAHRKLLSARPGYAEFEDRKLRAVSPHMYASIAPEFARLPDSTDKLKKLTAPTLVIVGEQDAPFIDASREMAQTIPGAQLEIIPDAGHSPQFENSQAWWQVLSGFLDRVS